MKKLISLALAAMLIALAMTGCGGDKPAVDNSASGAPSGASSEPQNRREKIKAAGKVDMAISGLAYKPDRAEQMGLSSPFNKKGYQGLLIRAEDNDKYQQLSDFNGKIIAAQSGSLQQANVETQLEGAQLEIISTINDGILMLKTGKVDALAMSGVQGDEFAQGDEAIVMAVPRFESDNSGNHVGMPKGEDELIEAVSAIVEEVEESGQYAKWQDEARELARSLKIS